MGSCTRAVGIVLLAVTIAGCVTGHLFEAGRRWEQPRAFEAASLDGGRLYVRYVAAVTDDAGVPRGERRRRAVVTRERLAGPRIAAEDVRAEQVSDVGPLPGRVVAIEASGAGAPAFLVVRDDRDSLAPLPANAFTTTSTAPWVYPLIPLALCVDATTVPVLLFFAPGAIVIGD
jgi:hypothetical protein